MVFYLRICIDQLKDGAKKFSKFLPEFWLVFLRHSVLNLYFLFQAGVLSIRLLQPISTVLDVRSYLLEIFAYPPTILKLSVPQTSVTDLSALNSRPRPHLGPRV